MATDDAPPQDAETPAERRLVGLLAPLGHERVEPAPGFAHRIARRARRQRRVRAVAGGISGFGAAAAGAVAVLLGLSGKEQ